MCYLIYKPFYFVVKCAVVVIGCKTLNTGQEHVSFDTLFEVLSTPPVLQDDTIFTSLYSPSDPDNFNITIRYDTASEQKNY